MLKSSQETETSFNFVISFQPSVLIDNTGILAHDNKTSFGRYLASIVALYRATQSDMLKSW